MTEHLVTLTLVLSQRHADVLRTNTMREFVMEQDGRFEHFDGPDPLDPRFRGGSLHWCETASDWLLLRAYEQARGHSVAMLSDLAYDPDGGMHDPYALLTDEPFDNWLRHLRPRVED